VDAGALALADDRVQGIKRVEWSRQGFADVVR
jgi:hypothetical protein